MTTRPNQQVEEDLFSHDGQPEAVEHFREVCKRYTDPHVCYGDPTGAATVVQAMLDNLESYV